MAGRGSYGTLIRADETAVEFTVDGRLRRTWKLSPPQRSMEELFHHALGVLGTEGWRPISHQSAEGRTVVLARIPYPAGTRRSTFGTLRFIRPAVLVLAVSGSIMQTWEGDGERHQLIDRALSELQLEGWRVHRRYQHGATVVRG